MRPHGRGRARRCHCRRSRRTRRRAAAARPRPPARHGCAVRGAPSPWPATAASGGVRSAIATTAEQALAALDDDGQAVARRILLRHGRAASRRRRRPPLGVSPRDQRDRPGPGARRGGDTGRRPAARRRPRPDHRGPRSPPPRMASAERMDRSGAGRPSRPPGGAVGGRALGRRWSHRGRPVPRSAGSTPPSSSPPASRCRDARPSSSQPVGDSATANRPRHDEEPADFESSPPSPHCSPSSPSSSGSWPSAPRARRPPGDDRRSSARRRRGAPGAGVRPRPPARGRGGAPFGRCGDTRQPARHHRAQSPGDRGDPERRLTAAGRGELAGRATRDRVRQP